MAAQPGWLVGIVLDAAVQQFCVEAGQNGNAQDMLDCSRPVINFSESQAADALGMLARAGHHQCAAAGWLLT